jgi:hypothetical protein
MIEEWFKNKKKNFFISLVYEIVCTFSNKPSFFASKRIERFVMFNVAIWMIIGYTVRNWANIEVTELIAMTGMLFAGGAWNAVQIRKDISGGVTSKPNENTAKAENKEEDINNV